MNLEMSREAVEARVAVVEEGEEAEAVHVVAVERGTAHGANILVDTETIGVLH